LVWDSDNNVLANAEAVGSGGDEATTLYSYNANGLMTSRTDPLGRTTFLTYANTQGLHCSRTSAIDTGEKPVSDLTAITRPNGETWASGYVWETGGFCSTPSTDGNVIAQADPMGEMQHTTYDQFGQLLTHQDESGDLTEYASYDDNGLPQEVFSPRAVAEGKANHRTLYRYDRIGNLRQVVDPRGAVSEPGGPLTNDVSVQRGRPYTTTLSYDSYDRLKEEHIPKCSASGAGCAPVEFVTRTHSYDLNNNETDRIDGTGSEWSSEYTPMDRIASMTAPPTRDQPAGQRTEYGYDAEEGLTKIVSPRGTATGLANDYTTRFVLDDVGRRVVTERVGEDGDEATEDDTSLITSYAYDLRDNVVGVAYPKQNPTVESATGNAANDATKRFEYRYDAADQLISEIENPGGGCTLPSDKPKRTDYRYDQNGNRIWEIGARGFCDPLGSVENAGEQTTFYHYNERDELDAVTDALGNTTDFEYTPDGLLESKTSPRGSATATDGDFTTLFTYNANDELTSRSIPWAQGEDGLTETELKAIKVQYTRDPAGDPVEITDGVGSLAAHRGQGPLSAAHTFTNKFFDTGELRTTQRSSWWRLDWDAGALENPDAGQHFAATGEGAGAEPDFEAPIGGPSLSEAPLSSQGGMGDSMIAPERKPAEPGAGDFGEVAPEALPDFLPRAGATELRYDNEMRLRAVEDEADSERRVVYDAAGRPLAKS
jgi:YD repeat-containing protein